jgi:hypothetical protein
VRVILLMSEDELNEKNWLDAVSHNFPNDAQCCGAK